MSSGQCQKDVAAKGAESRRRGAGDKRRPPGQTVQLCMQMAPAGTQSRQTGSVSGSGQATNL